MPLRKFVSHLLVCGRHFRCDGRIKSVFGGRWELLSVVGCLDVGLAATRCTSSGYGVVLRTKPRDIILVGSGVRPVVRGEVGFGIYVGVRYHQVPCVGQVGGEGVVSFVMECKVTLQVVVPAWTARGAYKRVVHAADAFINASHAWARLDAY